MSLSIDLQQNLTKDGTVSLSLTSTYNYSITCTVSISPLYVSDIIANWPEAYTVGSYEIKPNEVLNKDITLTKSLRKEWFGGFLGGTVQVTVLYKNTETGYSLGSKQLRTDMVGFYGDGNIKFGFSLREVSSKFTVSGITGRPYPPINNHNIPQFAFDIYPISGFGEIDNIQVFANYNLVETKDLTLYGEWIGENEYYTIYDARITEALFSPNLKFKVYITHSTPSQITGNPLTGTSGITIDYNYPLQDYHDPIIYAEMQTPLSAGGDGQLLISGRCVPSIQSHSGGKIYSNPNNLRLSYTLSTTTGTIIVDDESIGAPTVSEDGVYSTTLALEGLDYTESYHILVSVWDRVGGNSYASLDITNRAVFDWNHHDFNFNVPVYHQDDVIVLEDKAIKGINGDGTVKSVFTPQNSFGDTVIGFDNFNEESGNTLIYGNRVDIMAHEGVTLNGKSLFEQRVLWEGGLMMSASHTANLAENISDQANGIVLVFSLYRNGAAEDVSINSFFISKKEVELLSGAPHFFFLGINAGFSSLAGKYIYIHDNKLVGHEGNDDVGSSVISFNNSSYVLRYVIGV